MKAKRTKEHERLRKLARDFLHAIFDVPFRSIDCDQDKAERLYRKLAKESGFRQ